MRVEPAEKRAFHRKDLGGWWISRFWALGQYIDGLAARSALKTRCIWGFTHGVWDNGRLSQYLNLVDNGHRRQKYPEGTYFCGCDNQSHEDDEHHWQFPPQVERKATAPETWRRAQVDQKGSLRGAMLDLSSKGLPALLNGGKRAFQARTQWGEPTRRPGTDHPTLVVSVLQNHI